MRALAQALRRCNDIVTRGVKAVIVIMAVLMVAAILWQVCMRYVFNRPPSWTEELALLLFSWSMLLMLAVGVRESFHVRMDLLVDRLPAVGNRALQGAIDLATAAFGAYLAASGVDYALEMYGSTSAAIGYPIVLLYGAAPVCGVLVFLYGLELLWSRHGAGEQP